MIAEWDSPLSYNSFENYDGNDNIGQKSRNLFNKHS